jgi:hypothetical protein
MFGILTGLAADLAGGQIGAKLTAPFKPFNMNVEIPASSTAARARETIWALRG